MSPMRDPIERFEIKVRHGAITGRLVIDEFIDEFKAMQPSLHRFCGESDIVDVAALIYCTERLPDHIYHIREILVQADIPDKLPGMVGISEVHTPARRRSAFDIGEDTIIIVAREGVTELLDLVSLLVSFSIEGQKIVRLLEPEALMEELMDPELGSDAARQNQCLARLAFVLGVTDDEVVSLDQRWENQLLERLRHLIKYPPHMTVRLHKGYSLEAVRIRSEKWAARINEKVQKWVDHGPLHVLSSNLHSTVNLLSGFARLHQDEIWEWAALHPEYSHVDPPARENLLYFVLKDWLKANPERAREKLEYEEAHGILSLHDIYHVGIDVQLIDTSKLDPALLDPRLRVDTGAIAREKPLIVNFDYAFGDQAGIVLEHLFRNFERQIASFSIMGKAGTVVGERGGVMLPTYLLRQGSDDVYDFPVPNFLEAADFRDLPVDTIHTGGPMLTVLGTVLQNDVMLRRYRDEWKILGLEMEGIPYVRTLHQCRKRGFMSDNFRMGVGYYASDAPLVPGESLSRELAFEGLDATYSINLAILNRLLTARTVPVGSG